MAIFIDIYQQFMIYFLPFHLKKPVNTVKRRGAIKKNIVNYFFVRMDRLGYLAKE